VQCNWPDRLPAAGRSRWRRCRTVLELHRADVVRPRRRVANREQPRGRCTCHIGCIAMCFRKCIYDEILTNSIAFIIFRGAFTPPPCSVARCLPHRHQRLHAMTFDCLEMIRVSTSGHARRQQWGRARALLPLPGQWNPLKPLLNFQP
jgi:hypothetical protein